MSTPILATKLYLPSPRPSVIRRPRLLERLSAGLSRNLTLLSAPAGFGKTTLLSDWLVASPRPVAWLSLDEGDTDPARLLTYLVAAVQTVASSCGAGVLGLLASPQPLPMEALLTNLVNDFASLPERLVLVLDDYHRSATPAVDQALTFLLEHLPPQLHVVLATREDPQLPLARLRVRG
jgi:LuxR family maltose regulon positive regulatory protein